jgi:hypothetical protein
MFKQTLPVSKRMDRFGSQTYPSKNGKLLKKGSQPLSHGSSDVKPLYGHKTTFTMGGARVDHPP